MTGQHTATEWTNDEWPVCDITELSESVHRWMNRLAEPLPGPRTLRESLIIQLRALHLDHIADDVAHIAHVEHVEQEQQSRPEVDWRPHFYD